MSGSLFRWVCLWWFALALAGCAKDPGAGYAFSSSYGDAERTVYVPVFGNRTFVTGVEAELTEAITKEIQRATPWKVASGSSADTELVGEITGAHGRPVSVRSGTGLPEEQTYELTVDFVFRDAVTGEALVSKRRFGVVSTFVPERTIGERVEVGQRLAVQELARAIVRELRADW